jgi:hypothetical protein
MLNLAVQHECKNFWFRFEFRASSQALSLHDAESVRWLPCGRTDSDHLLVIGRFSITFGFGVGGKDISICILES